MVRRAWDSLARWRALLGHDASAARQSLVALAVSGVSSLVAGLTLGAATDRLEDMPGLLLMIPAAIALRGNVFGSLGSRLGTASHAGTLRLTWRLDTVLGQNMAAALILSLALSVAIAVMAKGTAVAFHVAESITLADFIVISTVGGMIASVLILGVTLLVAAGSVRYGWDMDDVSAPVISTFGDFLTLPALIVSAAVVAERDLLTPVVAALVTVAAVVLVVVGFRSRLRDLHRIVRESLPILLVAGLVDLIAGATVQARQESFLRFEALLVLLPGFLSIAGALGGILSSRLGTKFHLGLVEPGRIPPGPARADMRGVFVLAVPAFAFGGLVSHLGATLVSWDSPGIVDMLLIALLGGLLATVFVIAVAWFSTMTSYRFGLDPDTFGIPVVTSLLDLVGAFALILAAVAVGAA